MQPMRDYLHFINGTLYGHVRTLSCQRMALILGLKSKLFVLFQASGNVPRGATREGLKRFAAGFAWLPLFITSLFITVQYCLTEEFMAKPLWWRYGFPLFRPPRYVANSDYPASPELATSCLPHIYSNQCIITYG
jgi:hypothetical protein